MKMRISRIVPNQMVRAILCMMLLPISASAGVCQWLGGDARKACEHVSDHYVQPALNAGASAANGVVTVVKGTVQAAGGLGKVLTGNKDGWKDVQDGLKNMATGTVVAVTSGAMVAVAAADPVIGTVFFGAPSPLQGFAKFLYETISRWKGHPDCNPQEQLSRLMTVPKNTLGDLDRLSGVASTPAKYLSSIFDGTGAWEQTGCDGSGVGIPVRDGQISTDGFWTVDLKLADDGFEVQGQKATPGRFIRLEIVPGTAAHDSASAHNPKPSDVIRFSGPMIWDKDKDDEHPNGHMEVHPYGALMFGVKELPPPQPPPPPPPPPPTPGPATYEVEKGDCLSKIAEHFYGAQRWHLVFCANKKKIKEPDLIYPGQQFRLPVPGEEGYGTKCLIPRQ
jgi:hypothetical protein